MDIRKYHGLDSSIHSVSNSLSLKEDGRKKVNKQLSDLLEKYLLPAMKEVDENFRILFQRVHYSGSYYENLRICAPNEFDLNLELRSQERAQKFLQICSNENYPGFVQMRYLSSDIIKKWVNGNAFVLQNKVLSWLQGVIDKALLKISKGPFHRIRRKMSGPAVTLYVEYYRGEVFSVDLVPVFVFNISQWPSPPVRQPEITNNSYAEQWCVVPKPNNHIDQNGNSETFWRISFYNQEKKIMNNKNHLKNALKLMKLLRDKEGWHCLSSYYLKTVYLWTIEENNPEYWNAAIGIVFMEMLKILKNYLKNSQSIPFFWDKRLNLLSNVHHEEIQKIAYRLERIIKDIDRKIDEDPQYITSLFPQIGASNSLSPSPSPSEPVHQENLSVTTQQERAVGWEKFVLGVGALALGGAFLKYFNNRDQ